MDTGTLLTRNHEVKRPGGHSYRIREVHVRSGQSLAPGDAVCSLEYERTRLLSDDTTHLAECVFDVEKYGAVEVLDISAEVGQEVPKDGCALFSYAVPATIENALEPILTDLVKSGITTLHQSQSGIAADKREAAVEEYAQGVLPDRILFLGDATVFGSAKTGFVVTDSALYFQNDAETRYEVRFNHIKSWTQTEEVVPQENGDSEILKFLEIADYDDQTIRIPHTEGILDWANAGNLLDALIALRQQGKTRDSDGLIVFEDLPDETKLAYIEAIVWLVHHDDETIDVREFGELRLLMAQLNFSGELRRRTLAMMDDAGDLVLEQILERINLGVPKGAERVIGFSLVKDMVRVFKSAHGDEAPDSPQIALACNLLNIDDDQLELIQDAFEFDRKVLSGPASFDELKGMAEQLGSKAVAVGVPIAAIYMSGSVIGLSAAGMTSGLAALGFGGLLGLSSMATGIGVAVLLGVVAHRGVRWVISGKNEKEKRSQLRVLMLQEVLRNHQKAIAALGEDLAHFAQKIVGLSRDVVENKLKIEKIGKEMTLFADALAQIKRRGEKYESGLGSNADPSQDPSGEAEAGADRRGGKSA